MSQYTIERSFDNGIETITYRPHQPIYETPIIFQHGAWHGGWCWRWWQALFAGWGWVSHAPSLPGHGGSSPGRRPPRLYTLGHYTRFLAQAVARCERPPVLVGHSMGGMIAQWYLARYGDLPAVVLLASIPLRDNIFRYFRRDFIGTVLSVLTFSGAPQVRNPQVAAGKLINPDAMMGAEALHQRLNAESLLVALELNFGLWRPRPDVESPVLVMAADQDALFTIPEQKKLAAFYHAEYYEMVNTAHNAMMEANYDAHARYLHGWLGGLGVK
jgi:pimeloyl-ACP methyl ester carboxylesterase